MRRSLFFCLALASPAGAQTPLCAWTGASLACPAQPAPGAPVAPPSLPGALPTPEQQLNALQAQADFDHALIAAQAEQARDRAVVAQQADALIAAGDCARAETLVRESGQGDLAGVMSRCAAARK